MDVFVSSTFKGRRRKKTVQNLHIAEGQRIYSVVVW